MTLGDAKISVWSTGVYQLFTFLEFLAVLRSLNVDKAANVVLFWQGYITVLRGRTCIYINVILMFTIVNGKPYYMIFWSNFMH